MITAAATWLSARLLTRAGAVGLAVAALAVAALLGALGAALWVNHGLRADLQQAQDAKAACTSDLRTSQQNVGELDAKLSLQNKAVGTIAQDCREKDVRPAVEALQILQPPKEPRRWPDGAQGMNEWLASK